MFKKLSANGALEIVNSYIEKGFEDTWYDPKDGYFRVRCNQCQSMIINGVATHESGCPNQNRHVYDDIPEGA